MDDQGEAWCDIALQSKDKSNLNWEGLVSDYSEWFNSTVARLGGMEKFIFRVAHRSRRLDSEHERPVAWMAAMDQSNLENLIGSVTGYANERGGRVTAFPVFDPLIREAVTLLLEGTDRSDLTPRARAWDSASALVKTITECAEYWDVDTGALRVAAKVEVGMTLYRAGSTDEALRALGDARLIIGELIDEQTQRILEHEDSGEPGGNYLQLIRDRLYALGGESAYGFARTLISRGDYESANEAVDYELGPNGLGPGTENYIPPDYSATDLDYTYWRNDWPELASAAFDTAVLKYHLLLVATQGELLARVGKVDAAVKIWTRCLNSAEKCAELGREDVAFAVARSLQKMNGIRGSELTKVFRHSRGFTVLEHALIIRNKCGPKPRTHLRTLSPMDAPESPASPTGVRESPASDIDIEIDELELVGGHGAQNVLHNLSLAMRDGGDIEVANSMLERAAENSEPLALLEMGICELDAGNDQIGLKYLEEAAQYADTGEALFRLQDWSKVNGDPKMQLKWTARLVAFMKKERERL